MRLRPGRRDVVVWRSSGPPAGVFPAPRARRPPAARVRRWLRIGALVTVIAVRPRWQPLLAGAALTVFGLIERDGVGGLVLIPGLMFLWAAVLTPGDSAADHVRRTRLAAELAAYSTPAQRQDLAATLDQYADSATGEIRQILAAQAWAAQNDGIPGAGRC